MTTLSAGSLRADDVAARAAFSPIPATSAPAPAAQDAELHALLQPMLEAIVRLAGANAGLISVIGPDGGRFVPVSTVGLPPGGDALRSWCSACEEWHAGGNACAEGDLPWRVERLSAELLGPICRHIVAVPLRHKGAPVGTLNLMFTAVCAMPATMTPLLHAAGDLVGMTLDNARLARENLRLRLASERQMLANEVHDSLAQGIVYMRMRMSLLEDALRQKDELKARKLAGDVDETLGSSQRRLRELITYFRTRMDPLGLAHALQDLCDGFPDRTGIALDFDNRIADLSLPPEREIEVFNIVQEALANVSRHARARKVRLLMRRRDDRYQVVVEDDGVGLAARTGQANDTGHYGIAIMRERARRLGGTITLAAAEGGGTRVTLDFPAAAPISEGS